MELQFHRLFELAVTTSRFANTFREIYNIANKSPRSGALDLQTSLLEAPDIRSHP